MKGAQLLAVNNKLVVFAGNKACDFYAVLGVPVDAPRGVIRKAYLQKALEQHPEEALKAIREAFATALGVEVYQVKIEGAQPPLAPIDEPAETMVQGGKPVRFALLGSLRAYSAREVFFFDRAFVRSVFLPCATWGGVGLGGAHARRPAQERPGAKPGRGPQGRGAANPERRPGC